MIFHDFSIIFMIFHDFSMVFGALQWRYVHFWTFVFPKKRLAWIRTHARLRPSFSGLQAVVVTTPPRPRLRVKGARIEDMCKRTPQFPLPQIRFPGVQISKARFPLWIHVSLPSVFWVRFLREASGSSTLRTT